MSERILKYNDVVVTLKLDMSIGIGGDKWPAAELFCNIATNEKFIPSFESLFNGKRIMELGSGTGLCGIVIDKLYKPKEVYVSDLQSHVPHMVHNIQLNGCSENCKACEIDWGQDYYEIGQFDVILAFECVYKEELYEPFIRTMVNLSKSSKDTLIMIGMTRNFLKSSFFELMCTKYGIMYTLVPQEAVASEYCKLNGIDTGLFLCKINAHA